MLREYFAPPQQYRIGIRTADVHTDPQRSCHVSSRMSLVRRPGRAALQVKKLKSSTEATTPTPWVGALTTRHRYRSRPCSLAAATASARWRMPSF